MTTTPEDVIRDMHATRLERDELRKEVAALKSELDGLRKEYTTKLEISTADYNSIKELLKQREQDTLHYMRLATEAMSSLNNSTMITSAAAEAIAHGRYRQNGSGRKLDNDTQDEVPEVPKFIKDPLKSIEAEIGNLVGDLRARRDEE